MTCAKMEYSDPRADAQPDQGLRWHHMPFCWFCHAAAQIILKGSKTNKYTVRV